MVIESNYFVNHVIRYDISYYNVSSFIYDFSECKRPYSVYVWIESLLPTYTCPMRKLTIYFTVNTSYQIYIMFNGSSSSQCHKFVCNILTYFPHHCLLCPIPIHNFNSSCCIYRANKQGMCSTWLKLCRICKIRNNSGVVTQSVAMNCHEGRI